VSVAVPRIRRPRIGVSACLLGEPVRYDAGHKRDPFLVETFGPHVEWVPICPELEAGFGVPREPMRLELREPAARDRGRPFAPHLISLVLVTGRVDVTATMRGYAERRVDLLEREGLSGYVLKKDSPSCGMDRVKVYTRRGGIERGGRGLFAQALIARFPTLPVEEEGRLSDPRLRDNFVERVFAYERLQRLFRPRWRVDDLVQFHTAHKLTLMAHSPAAYRTLGRLVAGAAGRPSADVRADYEAGFMAALAVIATPGRHANVLHHMLGHFKDGLDRDARSELLSLIDDHRMGRVPLVVPLTLMKHHVRRQRIAYLEGQIYMDPHPRELSLRNHV
jgi:uncharacterized protein YbgA (DUF1722 family)/uncharacterized protein YbbK (DUF523 family)